VKIRVANAAEQDFDLYVVFGWFAPRDRGKGKRRCRDGSGVSFRVLHVPNLNVRRLLRYAKSAIVHAKCASMRLRLSSTSLLPVLEVGIAPQLGAG
jgi:hypothetical protein